jgi:menaquinone-dependent protoporphyrinogen oxidase
MSECPVFYATTEGHSRRIAERISAVLHEHGLESRAIDAASAEALDVDWRRVCGVAVGASVHAGRHQQAIETFIRAHRDQLAMRPSGFFSVSMRAASPRPADREGAEQLARTFLDRTGWQPGQVAAVAGQLAYTKYGWVMRWIIKRIARRGGLATDTTRDHDYTDWTQVARFAETLAAAVHQASARNARAAS